LAVRSIKTKLGPLTCRVVDTVPEGGTPGLLVVLCHGFGAPGTDLVPLAEEMCGAQPRLVGRTRFVFPEAPVELGGMGYYDARAWWMIDVERFATAQRQGRLAEMANEVPEGLDAARRQLTAAVEALLQGTRLDASHLVLGGFSQGAMVTTDLALRMDDAPAGLVVFSGTLLNQADWAKRAPRRRGLRVVQSHGRLDPLLPFANAELLRDLLVKSGLEVDFVPFDGPHTIPAEGLEKAAALAASALPA
jgi:phospholipase/carboxylesterase